MKRELGNIGKVIVDELNALMAEDKNVYLVGAELFSLFRGGGGSKFPERVIDVGIAEQDMIGVAAGVAYSGKTVYTSALAAITTGRAMEQIRLDCCYPNLNVNMFAQSRGFVYGVLGVTHQATEDIAMLRAIPNLTVILPADTVELAKVIRASVTTPGPKYIGVARGEVPIVYSEDYNFEIGKAVVMKEGKGLAIIATGDMVVYALDAAEVLRQEGITARVINMHTVKPLDEAAVIKAAKETGAILTVEDHSVVGGLGSAVADLLLEEYPVPLKKVGIPGTFCIVGTFEELLSAYKMDVPGIVTAARALLERKNNKAKEVQHV